MKSDLNSIHLGHHVTDFIGIRSWHDKSLNHTGERPPPRSGGKPPGPSRLLRTSTILIKMAATATMMMMMIMMMVMMMKQSASLSRLGDVGSVALWMADQNRSNDAIEKNEMSKQI